MPPISSPQKINPSFSLPVPKKPAVFTDPMTRAEIGPVTSVKKIEMGSSFHPSGMIIGAVQNDGKIIGAEIKASPLIPPLQKTADKAPVADAPAIAVTPIITKKEDARPGAPVTRTVADIIPPDKKRIIQPPETRQNGAVGVSAKKQPASNGFTASTAPKRKLPDEIKDILETTSKDFAAYAQNSKKSASLNAMPPPKMDEWDRALLLGEYSPAQISREKIKKMLSVPLPVSSSVPVPKKTDAYLSSTVFPGRVDGPLSPVLQHQAAAPVPTKVVDTNPAVSAPIPQRSSSGTSPVGQKPLTGGVVPIKPKQSEPIAKRDPVPAPNMSDKLVEKIIEGQMRSVFENAPPLLQKTFEKMTVKEIMGETKPGTVMENDVWQKRLREYVKKLQTQAQTVFLNPTLTDPNEGELLLDYVGRIYPPILKAQLVKQEKTEK